MLKHVGEQLGERRGPRAFRRRLEVEPLERDGRFDDRLAARAAVVLAAPRDVGEYGVGLLNLLVHRLGDPIPRIHTRVIAARQPTERPLDFG